MYRVFVLCIFFVATLVGQENEVKQLREELQKLRDRVQGLEQQLKEKETSPQESDKDTELRVDSLEKRVGAYEGIIKAFEDEKTEYDFDVFWDRKLVFQTKNKDIKITFGGFAQLDLGFVHEDVAIGDQIAPIEDFAEFRSFRPTITGELGRYFFVFQPDFAVDNEVAFRNVFFGVKGLPLNGKLQIGFFREFFSLEAVQGLADLAFLERATLVDLTPGFQLGAQYIGNAFDQRMTFALGIFKEVDDDDPPRVEDAGSFAGTMRITGLPVYIENGKYLVHLGAAYSYRSPLDDEVQFAARPEIAVGAQLANTGVVTDVDEVHLFGLEMAFVMSSFSVQSEAVVSIINIDNVNDDEENVWAFYAFATYLLTGEYRPYNKTSGTFSRVSPFNSFLDENNGIGAIELAVRYSKIELNDDTIRGRRLDDITLGVNWYINPFLRFQVNYIYSLLSNLDNADLVDAHILTMRLQVAF